MNLQFLAVEVPEARSELLVTGIGDLCGEAMDDPDFLQAQSCHLLYVNGGIPWNQVSHIDLAIDDHENGIVPFTFW